MSNPFFDHPILNSPYEYPSRHWELDPNGLPTQKIIEARRVAKFETPIPRPKKQSVASQLKLVEEGVDDSTDEQREAAATVEEIRKLVTGWRNLPRPSDWKVTPETERLLRHWRDPSSDRVRPFFCQLEAVETAIWLTEVAPYNERSREIVRRVQTASETANPGLSRVAFKLATGAGKTTVMAMLIAWQTINAARHPDSEQFTSAFLLVAPGLTIRDRLRVLLPNDPENYYTERGLVPPEFREEIKKAIVVITNYHAFRPRETLEIATGNRRLLEGRGPKINSRESDGQVLRRVMPQLMSKKSIFIINDEAHHCYRRKPADPGAAVEEQRADEQTAEEHQEVDAALEGLPPDERQEAVKRNKDARLWLTALEVVQAERGRVQIVDLSATPFFLKGSGYPEGTLFPWTVSDFGLMDAIESGIVKLPRVPVAENIPGKEMPVYRDLWANIRKDMPKKGRGTGGKLDPLMLPTRLQTALQALYGHYEKKTFKAWQEAKQPVPPCFIVVCQNTAISKLVFDYISGFHRENADGSTTLEHGRLPLFRNFDEATGAPLSRPNTLLIDSEQLESGDALNPGFHEMAKEEIDKFRNELTQRLGQGAGERFSDQELLREVLNTVGKPGKLGAGIRCVVSVSMLTEGWDAINVTHILGIRAFGTQLLCEQVVGRALRRQSYELKDGLFPVEYADIFGIPFDFTASPVDAPVTKPVTHTHVYADRPERDHLEIRYPRVEGYRVEPPNDRLTAQFNEESTLVLTPDLVGPSITRSEGIIGQGVNMTLDHLDEMRPQSIQYNLTKRLILRHWRDQGDDPRLPLFGQLKAIAALWLDHHLVCKGGTYPGLLMYQELADMACNRITAAITRAFQDDRPVKAMLDPYNPTGSTRYVRFITSRTHTWTTRADRSHVNLVVLDSDWEGELCRVVEDHPRVRAYVKNHGLGFEVPYLFGSTPRRYRPDFIVKVDDGRGDNDLLNLVIEIKGYRREDAKEKKATMETYWIPGVNQLKTHGRWAFAEFTDIYMIGTDFKAVVEREFDRIIAAVTLS